MNAKLFQDHFTDLIPPHDYGVINIENTNSTFTSFGAADDFSLPFGKYFYAFADEARDLPLPMFCLPLVEEMYDEGFVDCHHVLIWKLEPLNGPTCDLPFDDPAPEGTIDNSYVDICPGEAIYN